MRLLNEKTVAKLGQIKHFSREGFLNYSQPGDRCANQGGSSDAAKRQFFRLCGNLLYRFDAADARALAITKCKPRGVLLLVGHIVEPYDDENSGCCSNCDSNGNASQKDAGLTSEPVKSIEFGFYITWPICHGAARNGHRFAASSAEDAALWIRTLIAASPECVSTRAESMRAELQQITATADNANPMETESDSSSSHCFNCNAQSRHNPFGNSLTMSKAVSSMEQFSTVLTQRLDIVMQMMLEAEDRNSVRLRRKAIEF